MTIYTSYFANPVLRAPAKKAKCVSIARWAPRWFGANLKKYPDLYPSLEYFEWIKVKPRTYGVARRRFINELSRLDAKKVFKALDGKILLCYEKLPKPCHRHWVAEWLEEALKIEVKEIGVDKTEFWTGYDPTGKRSSFECFVNVDFFCGF